MSAPRKETPPVVADDKCGRCTGKCCTYVTQPLDTPRSMRDFDLLLWQVGHEGVEVYKDSDGWFLMFIGSCAHLQPDGRCGIYEERPLICREHSNDFCEFDSPAEDGFELYFTTYEEMQRYCRRRFRTWDRRFERQR
ncbi:MAG TPA: YkgJ family cysteine cluster protein [Gammaproteobacteria bacterium]|nr:YkgJ family cysteine cluster protein [Gammaproteobacteria bacterium]